jgi:hypothetical protein
VLKFPVDLVHKRREVLIGVALRPQQHDGKVEAENVLLVRYALVRAQHDVEALLSQAQQLAVRLASPTGLRHRNDLVPLSKVSLQPAVYVLVQEYPQLGYSKSRIGDL